jgi:uncharacterized protein (DUF1501 family)
MPLTRRTFIQGGVATGVSVAFLSGSARAASSGDGRCLVVLQMSGGNDTLNTFVPYADARYRAARPTLSIPEASLLPLDDTYALHPAMARLLPLYQSRKFAFITDVGFASLDRSHFYCSDVWNYGTEAATSDRTGWLGRFADTYLNAASPLTSISIGARAPAGTAAHRVMPTTIIDLPSFDIDLTQSDPIERSRFIASVRSIYSIPRPDGDPEFIRQSGATMLQTIDLLKTAPPPSVTANYPKNPDGSETDLAHGFRIVAQTIAANLGTTIAWITIDGFDTHAQQVSAAAGGGSTSGNHARLLANLAGSVAAFQDELEQRRIADRVLLFAWSEFSRRLAENASLGTDHGKAATAFVLGNSVKGGTWYGARPDLGDLDDGDLRTRTDFRALYSTIIRDWLGRDPLPILGAPYENLGFIERGVTRIRAVRH